MKEDILNVIAKPQPKKSCQETLKQLRLRKSGFNGRYRNYTMSPKRKVISKRMSDSYFTAPTFTLNYEIIRDRSTES